MEYSDDDVLVDVGDGVFDVQPFQFAHSKQTLPIWLTCHVLQNDKVSKSQFSQYRFSIY